MRGCSGSHHDHGEGTCPSFPRVRGCAAQAVVHHADAADRCSHAYTNRFHACVDVPEGDTCFVMMPFVVPARVLGPPVGFVPRPTRAWMCRDSDPRLSSCTSRFHACVDVPVAFLRPQSRAFLPITTRAWMRRTRRRRASSPSRPRPRAGRVPSTAADRPKEYAMPYILEKSSLPRQVDVVAGRQQRRCPIVPRASMCRRRTHNGPTLPVSFPCVAWMYRL